MSRRARSVVPVAITVAGALLLAACSCGGDDTRKAEPTDSSTSAAVPIGSDADAGQPTGQPAAPRARFRYPPAPSSPGPEAPSAPEALAAIDRINALITAGELDLASVAELGEVGDARHGWFLSDLLRFFRGEDGAIVVDAFRALTGVDIGDDPQSASSPWVSVTNHLIAWDIPAYERYREDKAAIFLQLEPGWEPFFAEGSAIDWRLVSWGGVFIDDRALDDTDPCPGGCIPALDDPAVTDAAEGEWYPDDLIVFGLVEGDEALAIPKNIAEIHEMFNLTLGGRRLGVPYCTLCGSAQAFYTDAPTTRDGTPAVVEQPVLRTSGLLSRSNKVMYDLVTKSVIDTFTGEALSGPLFEQGVVLDEATVVRSTWGAWKAAHPDTAIVARDGGIGRSYALDPLDGRDDDGPIFPIGDADERLDVQELVVGVIAADGTALAFPSDLASRVLASGGTVSLGGISLVADGDGLRAVDATGGDVAAHEAFWFAWSQFHPDTLLYEN
jgi:hypothetical protein